MSLTSFVLLTVSATCLATAAFVWRRRSAPGALALMCFLFCVALWNAGYGLEVLASGVGDKLFWAKAEYPGVFLLPVAFFAFSVEHSGHRAWARAGRLATLALVPCAMILLAWTNERHHLIWTDIAAYQPAGRVLDLGHGPVFYFGALYAYGLIAVASVTLLSGRGSHRRFYRRQSLIVLIAIVTPWVANVLYLLGIPKTGFDTTTIAFAVTATAISLGCIRWGLLDVVPVARDAVVEHMSDGMVVLDLRGRVVDCNRAAQPVLLCPVEDAVGRHADEALMPIAPVIRTIDERVYEVEDYGHAAGDQVLVATARRLEQCLRPGDALARLGGDEFAVLIPRLDDHAHAGRVADRIAIALADPVAIERGAVVATASIGVHVATAGEATPESLLRGADRGMYAAKRRSFASSV